jgi:hypothetical protein
MFPSDVGSVDGPRPIRPLTGRVGSHRLCRRLFSSAVRSLSCGVHTSPGQCVIPADHEPDSPGTKTDARRDSDALCNSAPCHERTRGAP